LKKCQECKFDAQAVDPGLDIFHLDESKPDNYEEGIPISQAGLGMKNTTA
jgi:hypothetical protein